MMRREPPSTCQPHLHESSYPAWYAALDDPGPLTTASPRRTGATSPPRSAGSRSGEPRATPSHRRRHW